MNLIIIGYIIGIVLQIEALFLIAPTIVGLCYHEYNSSIAYATVAVICLLTGIFLRRRKFNSNELYPREGFVAVALSWISLSLFGSIPFMLTGEIPNFINALFETVSGLTTTGASILSDVESLTHASIFWRSFTHWIGGMGVFIIMLAIMPFAGAHSMSLMRAESPGPSVGKFLPKIRDTAILTYAIYLALTLIITIAFRISGMSLFDALTMTFGTVGTGGFGIYNDSAASFTPLQQNLITIFMILCGVNYNTYFCLVFRRFKEMFSSEEVRAYFIIILSSAGIITWNIRHLYLTLGESLRHAFFQVGSIITTSGFSTVDFDQWPQLSRSILIILMFIGACAGSTGGGMKVSRILILIKSVQDELYRIIHPHLVKKKYFDNHILSEETLRSTNAFTAIYFVLFFLSVLLIGMDELDFTTDFTAVASMINNIGPGFNLVGPTCNFDVYGSFSKCVLIFDMLAGRLELFPILVLFMPSCWKKY
ncbi:MAG: TrkH family potassium uptake protein [Lachnospiraceae bacterium]|nr:TrkH family potassium uptake protein [Lachnospiraceae bacterium]